MTLCVAGVAPPDTTTLTSNKAAALTGTGVDEKEQDWVPCIIVHDMAVSARSDVAVPGPVEVTFVPARSVYKAETPGSRGESALTVIDVMVQASGAMDTSVPSSVESSSLVPVGFTYLVAPRDERS